MTSRLDREFFEYIEKKGSISVDDVVEKFGIKRRSAATKLSRMANFKNKDGTVRHYLVRVKDEGHRRGGSFLGGRYKMGPDWWGERFYSVG